MRVLGFASVSLVLVCFLFAARSVGHHMNAKDAPCQVPAPGANESACFDIALQKSGAELNRFYRRVETVVKGDDLAKLKQAQRLWVQYRDANCDAEYELCKGGSAGPMVKLACLEAVTRHGTEELKVMYGWRLEKWDQ